MVMTLMFFKILIRISNFMRNLLVETNYFEILEGIVTQETMQGNLGYLILKLMILILKRQHLCAEKMIHTGMLENNIEEDFSFSSSILFKTS